MDIDNQNRKYAGAPNYGSSSSSKPYESRGSRSNRGNNSDLIENNEPRRGSSARHSSSRGSRTRYSGSSSQQQPYGSSSSHHQHHYQSSSSRQQHHQQHHQQQPQPQGPTNAPIITPNQHFTPPQSSYRNETNFPPPAVTSESPPPNEPQQRRPAYLLHRDLVIGKGSYGQVCIASRGEAEGHLGSNRSGKRKKFACKCVMLRNDPKYISKLQEEVNVLRELRGHDNVIRLYDVFCVDNELFIITELGRGGDLFHLLTTHPKHGVTEAYAAKTVSEMLSAVAFLHSRSICHRDLKLENWVLESGKDVWSPLKLIDFGLSTHYRSGERLTRVVGSSYYVAPEVLKKSYTEACDLWSLGVIVYMLLSGAPPFYGKNDEAIKASIVQGEYTFPHELFRDVTDQAMGFVGTLLSYTIEYRYTAAQALAHPWLATHCDQEALVRARDGARGVGIVLDGSGSGRPEPMQL
eukprot:CAMPEP_0116143752 /NCGR_PEP_ID=MMETSP0329-20121206/15619_1 /TAXON_ID=697910 /ORGANISM="Pseudo-nitzschia arenysensis, Strain B593" /LENGTH=463 /DNA_ID=CAMNT_0003639095 /DNA_START=551 /DNA_END=1942 /DNA_ORIENTATION=+